MEEKKTTKTKLADLPCDFCDTNAPHLDGVICDRTPVAGRASWYFDCVPCADYRSRDMEANSGHRCLRSQHKKKKDGVETFALKPNDTWERYGAYTPDTFPEDKKQCQRCKDANNPHCDVDAFLGYGCSFCDVPTENRGGRGRGKKKKDTTQVENPPADGSVWMSHECTLPGSNIELRRRPVLARRIATWFRHSCPKCETAVKARMKNQPDSDPGEPCSWLIKRTNKNDSCVQCNKDGLRCQPGMGQDIYRTDQVTESEAATGGADESPAEGNELLQDEAGETEPQESELGDGVKQSAPRTKRTWRLPSVKAPGTTNLVQKADSGKGQAVINVGNRIRASCSPCDDANAHCKIDDTAPWGACPRCREMGISCVDYEENEWPIGDLSRVGFGHATPFPICQPCVEQKLNCDRQTPCDSCLAAGRGHRECRDGPNPEFKNCLAGRLEPAPGPLYYLALGYGAGGVNTRKTMEELEDWIGPDKPVHGVDVYGPDVKPDKRGNIRLKTQMEGIASSKRNQHGNHPPDISEPPLVILKPAYALTVEDIRMAIRSGWENARAPADYKRNLEEYDAMIPQTRRKRKAPTTEESAETTTAQTNKRQKQSNAAAAPPPTVPATTQTTLPSPAISQSLVTDSPTQTQPERILKPVREDNPEAYDLYWTVIRQHIAHLTLFSLPPHDYDPEPLGYNIPSYYKKDGNWHVHFPPIHASPLPIPPVPQLDLQPHYQDVLQQQGHESFPSAPAQPTPQQPYGNLQQQQVHMMNPRQPQYGGSIVWGGGSAMQPIYGRYGYNGQVPGTYQHWPLPYNDAQVPTGVPVQGMVIDPNPPFLNSGAFNPEFRAEDLSEYSDDEDEDEHHNFLMSM